MYCNKVIQDELNEVMCPFCYKRIKERSVIVEKCWGKQRLENKDHVIVMTVNQSKSFVASIITMSNNSLVDMSQVILF